MDRPAESQERHDSPPPGSDPAQDAERQRDEADRRQTGGQPGQGRDRGDERIGAGERPDAARATDAALPEQIRAGRGEHDDDHIQDEPSGGGGPWSGVLVAGRAGRRQGAGEGRPQEQSDRDRRDDRRCQDRRPIAAGGNHGDRGESGDAEGRDRDDEALEEERPDDLAEGRATSPDEGQGRPATPSGHRGDQGEGRDRDAGRPDRDHGQDRLGRRPARRMGHEQRQQAAPHRHAIGCAVDDLGLREGRLEAAQVDDRGVQAGRGQESRIDEPAPRVADRRAGGLAELGDGRIGRVRQDRADIKEPGVAADRADRDLVEGLVLVPEGVGRVHRLEDARDPGRGEPRPAGGQRIAGVDREEHQIAEAQSALAERIGRHGGLEDRDRDRLLRAVGLGRDEGAELLGQIDDLGRGRRRAAGADPHAVERSGLDPEAEEGRILGLGLDAITDAVDDHLAGADDGPDTGRQPGVEPVSLGVDVLQGIVRVGRDPLLLDQGDVPVGRGGPGDDALESVVRHPVEQARRQPEHGRRHEDQQPQPQGRRPVVAQTAQSDQDGRHPLSLPAPGARR